MLQHWQGWSDRNKEATINRHPATMVLRTTSSNSSGVSNTMVHGKVMIAKQWQHHRRMATTATTTAAQTEATINQWRWRWQQQQAATKVSPWRSGQQRGGCDCKSRGRIIGKTAVAASLAEAQRQKRKTKNNQKTNNQPMTKAAQKQAAKSSGATAVV